MRILVISNLYPPYYIGGYELGCKETVDALREKGHQVWVLTSTYGTKEGKNKNDIYRILKIDPIQKPGGIFSSATNLIKKEILNQRIFRKIVVDFNPHLIYVWNLAHLSISLISIAQEMKIPVCVYVFDSWLSRWKDDRWYSIWYGTPRRIPARYGKYCLYPFFKITGFIPLKKLKISYAQFASNYLQDITEKAGCGIKRAEVIHWGIKLKNFPFKEQLNAPLKLLYVGQIIPHKGVDTAIKAMEILVHKWGFNFLRLTVVGKSTFSQYESYIFRLTSRLNLTNNIQFPGFLPREKLPQVYQKHDILIFPSIWEEPFGITILEAMASGLGIVASGTGGSKEILTHKVNSLIFSKGDPVACASQIKKLIEHPGLFEKLRRKARHTVEKDFNFEGLMKKIEATLESCVKNAHQFYV